MNTPLPTFPIILPDRQERFCQLYVQGLNGTEAYKKAYSSSSDAVAAVNSSRMLRRVKVMQRIDQIRADLSAAQRVSLPFLTAGLRRAVTLAESLGQPSAAVAGWMGIAKLHGFLVDRQQVDLLVRRPSASPESPDEMSEEDWLKAHGIAEVTSSIDHEPEPEGSASIDEVQDVAGASKAD